MVELKEAEEKSLKESERLEKEIAEVQELKVIGKQCPNEYCFIVIVIAIVDFLFFFFI